MSDVYLVFISKFDPFQENRTIYHINRVIEETGMVVEHQKFQKLSKRVKYFKESQEGVSEMCQLVEEYAEEKAKKAVNEAEIKATMSFLKNGASVELVSKSLPSLSVELIKELQKKLV